VLMDITLWVKGIKEINRKDILMDYEYQKNEEEQFLTRIRATLSAPWFVENAPAHVVEEKKKKMEEVKAKIAKIIVEIQKIKIKHK
jgi:valyl-tRNA synthetase